MAEVRPNRLGECQGSYINPRGFYLDSVQAADQCCRRENHISDVSEVDAEYFENADEHEDHDIMPFHDEPAPPYERFQRTLNFTQADSHTEATITQEGHVDIIIDADSSSFSKLIPAEPSHGSPPPSSPPFGHHASGSLSSLNVVIQLVGSRGDIQPFLSVGLQLQAVGHRVRIATHPTFQSFVEDNGLEFFNISGDPTELMAYMVRNAGLIPDINTVAKGQIRRKRKVIREIMEGCWRSCTESGNGFNTDSLHWRDSKPFVADAIISNPPTFAHIHCAEKLGVPLHLMFTMPWSPTQAFAHPLANIRKSTAESRVTNLASYVLIETITWQGIGGIVNSFRRKMLGLDRIDSTWAPGMVTRLKIPHTYCWSPSLIPKPKDWGCHLNVSGFSMLPSGSSYTPPAELQSFIQNGASPVYIGFGSIVVDDPQSLADVVFEATRIAGVRAVVAQGWGNLGEMVNVPGNIFLVQDCPHDWLFKHVSCVVHHGGAGTTAAGLAAGKPSVVVPFFGDQQFWGNMVAQAGAGPQPIPYRMLSPFNLADAIERALKPEMLANARLTAAKINGEHGSETAARSFQENLPLRFMTCSLSPHKAAAWQHRRNKLRLSALAATVLVRNELISSNQLELCRTCDYELNHGPWEPFSGGLLAVSGLLYNLFKGFGEIGSDVVRLSANVESLKGGQAKNAFTYSVSERSNTDSASSKPDSKTLGSGSLKGTARIL